VVKPFLKIASAAFCAYFLSWLFVYKTGLNSLAIQSEDTLPAMFIPVSIIKDGTFYADKYYEMIRDKYPHPDDKSFEKDLTPFYFKNVAGHYISAFTILPGLLALPVYVFPIVFGMPITFDNLAVLSHVSSALTVSFSTGFLFLLLRKHFVQSQKTALLLSGIFAFCTINFALVSQGLWQHGPAQLFIILALYFLYEKKWFFSSLFLCMAVLSRPTAMLFMPFLFGVSLIKSGGFKFLSRYLAGFFLPVMFFFWYNQTFYLDISNQGYASQLLVNWKGRFPEGFAGLWLSPSKGILVYSPVFLFSLWGFVISAKNWRKNTDYLLYFLAAFSYTMLMGRWKHWYGGYSFGYRMASETIPFLVILAVPFLESSVFGKYKRLFVILMVFSILIQLAGIVFFDGIWHGAYDRGFEDTKWLWSLRDSEFVFNLRRVLVKLGFLERACTACLPK